MGEQEEARLSKEDGLGTVATLKVSLESPEQLRGSRSPPWEEPSFRLNLDLECPAADWHS